MLPKRVRNHVNPLSSKVRIDFSGFKNDKNIIIDIGSYRGEFGEKLLNKFTDEKNFIFFEIRKPYQIFLEEKFKDRKNVQVFGGDAGVNILNILKHCNEKNILIEKIFINFPDPWFKKKHHKRRILNENFLKNIYDFLNKKTEIIWQTDQKKLYKETLEILKKNKNFYKHKRFFFAPLGIRTYWENLKKEEGQIFFFRLKILKK